MAWARGLDDRAVRIDHAEVQHGDVVARDHVLRRDVVIKSRWLALARSGSYSSRRATALVAGLSGPTYARLTNELESGTAPPDVVAFFEELARAEADAEFRLLANIQKAIDEEPDEHAVRRGWIVVAEYVRQGREWREGQASRAR